MDNKVAGRQARGRSDDCINTGSKVRGVSSLYGVNPKGPRKWLRKPGIAMRGETELAEVGEVNEEDYEGSCYSGKYGGDNVMIQ